VWTSGSPSYESNTIMMSLTLTKDWSMDGQSPKKYSVFLGQIFLLGYV
jgi:hypothetical protein